MASTRERTARRLANLSLAFFTLGALGIGGCSRRPPRHPAGPERTCVQTRKIRSIGALESDRYAFAAVGAGHYYLLSVESGCLGLRFARGLAVAGGEPRVCDDGFGFLVFVDPDQGSRRCRIEDIDAVEDKATARELIAARESDSPPQRR